MPSLPNGFFYTGLPTKPLSASLLSHLHATFPAHVILLDLIIQTIFVEEYRSLSSSVRVFRHSLVNSSLLGPNNIHGTRLVKCRI